MEYKLLKRNYLTLVLIGILAIIDDIIRQNYVSSIMVVILVTLLLFLVKLGRKLPNFFNYQIFLL